MHKLFHFILIFSSILVVAIVLDSRGRATSPPHETRSEEATVDVEDYLYSCLRQHHEIKDTRLPFEIYVQKLDGRKLIGPVLKHKNSRGEVDYVVQARDGELTMLREKRELRIHLYQGRMKSKDAEGYFETQNMSFDVPKSFGPK
jgi:hypothetical protein